MSSDQIELGELLLQLNELADSILEGIPHFIDLHPDTNPGGGVYAQNIMTLIAIQRLVISRQYEQSLIMDELIKDLATKIDP